MLSLEEPAPAQQQLHVAGAAATGGVLGALATAVEDASPRGPVPQREGEKTWIRERLARKRSVAEREQHQQQGQQEEVGEGLGQQSTPSPECDADRTTVGFHFIQP